jgi:hypothetical protein
MISLYDISVANYLQTLTGLGVVLDKGMAFCKEKKIDPDSLVETRLYEDMRPFRFQVQQSVGHSRGALDAVKSGSFSPGPQGGESDGYAALQALVADARASLQSVKPEEINARAGTEVVFTAGKYRMPFTAEGFVLSFSLPNFYFHVTTAYDILRLKGVPLGKPDYLGPMRMKQ